MSVKKRVKAIDRFIAGCKTDGIYDDLNAACIMAGWDGLAGALTPLKGTAPTNSGFLDTDYDRGGIGIAGDGSSYLNSNRDNNADGPNDQHLAVFATSPSSDGKVLAGRGLFTDATTIYRIGTYAYFRNRSGSSGARAGAGTSSGFYGSSRNDSSQFYVRAAESTGAAAIASTGVIGGDIYIFTSNGYAPGSVNTDATLAFYSIGSSLGSDPATGLAALDARVSTLMADLRAIEETGFDRDAIAYIRAVEEADGAYLETDVKIAVNNLVSGLKADDLWDAIGSSCLLCGPRTLAGALVPLRGDAPTPYGFVSGDHSRTDGLRDPEGTSYLDSGFNVSDEYLNDVHISAYSTLDPGGAYKSVMGAYSGTTPTSLHMSLKTTVLVANVNNTTTASGADTDGIGFIGASREDAVNANTRAGGTNNTLAGASTGVSGLNIFVFARNNNGSAPTSDMRLAFYSAGTFLDLAKLDSHVSAYVSAIGAAI